LKKCNKRSESEVREEDHKVANGTMKFGVVVITPLTQSEEIFTRSRDLKTEL